MPNSELPALIAKLPEKQRQKLSCFKSNKRRHEYLFSRLLICEVLSRLFSRPTQFWQIEDRNRAAPLIHNLPKAYHFSLSHSYTMVGFTLSHSPVGLDIELLKPRTNFHDLAEQFMTPYEVNQLPHHEPALTRYFYRLWCAKEAFYKALSPEEQQGNSLVPLEYSQLLTAGNSCYLTENSLHGYQVSTVTRCHSLVTLNPGIEICELSFHGYASQ